jgi:hypothetical protein
VNGVVCQFCTSFLLDRWICVTFSVLFHARVSGQFDWIVNDGAIVMQRDSLNDALTQVKKAALQGEEQASRTESDGGNPWILFYEWEDQDDDLIFTPANLRGMCRVERAIRMNPEWQNICLLNAETRECAAQPTSVVELCVGGYE